MRKEKEGSLVGTYVKKRMSNWQSTVKKNKVYWKRRKIVNDLKEGRSSEVQWGCR